MSTSNPRQIVVFSGGSAANSLVDVFNGLLSPRRRVTYVIGISDNGGSTSEILRVFGGPGIGDVRSRLIRLVPNRTGPAGGPEDEGRRAVKQLLNYRLPGDAVKAKLEWDEMVEGTHELWKQISSEKKELIRSFFIFLHAEIVKRARPPTSTFNFHSASIGNLFLTGARIFFGSFESAIYLFRSVAGVPEEIQVLPAINSNFAHHIAAGLRDGTVIVGQNQISHPSAMTDAQHSSNPDSLFTTLVNAISPNLANAISGGKGASPVESSDEAVEEDEPSSDQEDNQTVEDANLPGSLKSLRSQNIMFEKDSDENPLSARIERIWYINPYGQEIRPPANPKVVQAVSEAEAVVYSIGSLYTSIIPCLILRSIPAAISCPSIPNKILILNGSNDRETGAPEPYTASDFVRAIVSACTYAQTKRSPLSPAPTPRPSMSSTPVSNISTPSPNDPFNPTRYITHMIYLEGPGTPKVNVSELRGWGIECIKVYGRRKDPNKPELGMLYDIEALRGALDAILGKGGRGAGEGGGRRFTLDSGVGQDTQGNTDGESRIGSSGMGRFLRVGTGR